MASTGRITRTSTRNEAHSRGRRANGNGNVVIENALGMIASKVSERWAEADGTSTPYG
jgi:hypothetical protein